MKSISFTSFYEALNHKNPYERFFRDLHLDNENDVLCYLQYLPARHVLIARAGKGLASFDNLGINLSLDKSFDLDKLKKPQNFSLLKEFVQSALERRNYFACSVESNNEPIGLIVLASHRPVSSTDFNFEWVHGLELIASHRMISRKLEKFDQFCPDTEILTPVGVSAQLHKEVVRARRLKQPVSAIVFAIDNFQELSKSMNGIQKKNWLIAVGKLLKSNSRINDLVGRLSEELFVVVLPHTSLEGAKTKALRLSRIVSESTLKVAGQSLKFTLSSSLNEYPRISEDAEELLSKGIDLVRSNKNASSVLIAGSRMHFQSDFDVEKQ